MRGPTLFGPMFDPMNTIFGLICVGAIFYVDYKTKSLFDAAVVGILLAVVFSGGKMY